MGRFRSGFGEMGGLLSVFWENGALQGWIWGVLRGYWVCLGEMVCFSAGFGGKQGIRELNLGEMRVKGCIWGEMRGRRDGCGGDEGLQRWILG